MKFETDDPATLAAAVALCADPDPCEDCIGAAQVAIAAARPIILGGKA